MGHEGGLLSLRMLITRARHHDHSNQQIPRSPVTAAPNSSAEHDIASSPLSNQNQPGPSRVFGNTNRLSRALMRSNSLSVPFPQSSYHDSTHTQQDQFHDHYNHRHVARAPSNRRSYTRGVPNFAFGSRLTRLNSSPSPPPYSTFRPSSSLSNSNPRYYSNNVQRPSHYSSSGRFDNPWPSASHDSPPRFFPSASALVRRDRKYSNEVLAAMLLLCASPEFDKAARITACDERAIVWHWIGHATFVFHFNNLVFLTDPVWSQTLGPNGTRRLIPPVCEIDNLPEKIHFVLLSSASYDHFDKQAIARLVPRVVAWLVPLGVGRLLESCGVGGGNIIELDWWEQTKIGNIEFACTPSQHHSPRRGTLWCGWYITTPLHRVFFCGGTGYRAVSRADQDPMSYKERADIQAPTCPVFREICQRHGPCDVAFLPMGHAMPRPLMSAFNSDPVDIIFIHKDLCAMRTVAHFWGTFEACQEGLLDCPRMLEHVREKSPVSEDEVTYPRHGQLNTI